MRYDQDTTENKGERALLYQLELGLAISSKHNIRYKRYFKFAVKNLTVTYILREICAHQSGQLYRCL